VAKRSQLRAKVHAANVRAFKLRIKAPDDPVVVRERSQKRYKATPNRRRVEMMRCAYIVRQHGVSAVDLRKALYANGE
jgi:hypothetical protein